MNESSPQEDGYYSSWTTLRLLHYWFWRPDDVEIGLIRQELLQRGFDPDILDSSRAKHLTRKTATV